MPKLKTNRGAAKRFRVCGGKRIKRSHAFLRHLLTHKSSKRKRAMRGVHAVHPSNMAQVRAMLPN